MAKIVPLFKAILWELCNKFFSYIFSLCKIKGCYYWKCKFYNLCIRDPASGLLQIGYNSEKWQWRTTFQKFINFFWPCSISLVKFSYWPKFHFNIMTGVTNIFAYKGLTRNLEIVNTSFWFFPVSWDWDKLEIPNLARMSLTKCYYMLQNARVMAFTVFELRSFGSTFKI